MPPSPPTLARPIRTWTITGLIATLFALGISLRVAALSEPVWLDELHTAWCMSSSVRQIAPRAMLGNQSPLFFWICYPVYQGFGPSEWSLRLVPLLASFLTLASAGLVAWRLTASPASALVAIGIVAIDDLFLFFSVEARPYGCVQLVTLWQVYLLCRCLQNPQPMTERRWLFCVAGLASTSVLLFYLHYTTILLLAVEAIVMASVVFYRTVHRQYSARALVYLNSMGLIAALICLPGIWHLQSIAEYREYWSAIVNANRYWLRNFANWFIYVGPPLVCLACCGNAIRHQSRGQYFTIFVVVICAVFIPALVFYSTVAGFASLATDRFTIASATVAVLLAAVLIGLLENKSKWLACALVLALCLTTNPLFVEWLRSGRLPHQRGENWRGVCAQTLDDRLPVFVLPNLVEDASFSAEPPRAWSRRWADYYLFPVTGLYSIHDSNRLVTGRPIAESGGFVNEFWLQLKTSNGAWLVIRSAGSEAERLNDEIVNRARLEQIDVDVEILSESPLFLIRYTLASSTEDGKD